MIRPTVKDSLTVHEGLRDCVARAIYEVEEERGNTDRPAWDCLSERKRHQWRNDADRALAAIAINDEAALRVARAIYGQPHRAPINFPSWDDLSTDAQAVWCETARAALTALAA